MTPVGAIIRLTRGNLVQLNFLSKRKQPSRRPEPPFPVRHMNRAKSGSSCLVNVFPKHNGPSCVSAPPETPTGFENAFADSVLMVSPGENRVGLGRVRELKVKIAGNGMGIMVGSIGYGS
ncbi:hypothetical protein RJ641_029917 [Dillenia turbinata]|uniref:Uncharacterized protein n=1 Tax=Dillenia turbinata TaxID=194707 RepID=A0AAN8W287_9MAGN